MTDLGIAGWAPDAPNWWKNLIAAGRATAQVGADTFQVDVRVVSDEPVSLAVVRADEPTLRRIARGTYSPVTPYLDGVRTLSGDSALAKGILQKICGAGSTVDVCPVLTSPSSQLNGPYQYGTLTLTGQFFTPDGEAVLVYDMGGEGATRTWSPWTRVGTSPTRGTASAVATSPGNPASECGSPLPI